MLTRVPTITVCQEQHLQREAQSGDEQKRVRQVASPAACVLEEPKVLLRQFRFRNARQVAFIAQDVDRILFFADGVAAGFPGRGKATVRASACCSGVTLLAARGLEPARARCQARVPLSCRRPGGHAAVAAAKDSSAADA